MDSKAVCFLHSSNLDLRKIEILDYLIAYIQSSGLLDHLEYIFINNIGAEIPTNHYDNRKIIVMNYSSNTDLFENCTLRQMYFFSQYHPDYKILYLHTKGVGYRVSDPFFIGVRDWVDFMLYCLVDSYTGCLEMLDYTDVVGVNYRNRMFYENPDHFSGNFWWANSNYIKTNSVYKLTNKYDAEFWLFQNQPTFVNIHTCPYGHYENAYPRDNYTTTVTNNIVSILSNLKAFRESQDLRILYGVPNTYCDITEICHDKLITNGILNIPCGDSERNKLFTDPIPGTFKHIRIGASTYSYYESVRLPVGPRKEAPKSIMKGP